MSCLSNRKSIEIPGVSHGKAPIPMGAKIGNIIFSSGIMGKDPETNTLPDDPIREVECLFGNVRAFMNAAEGTTDDILRMTVFLKDNELRPAFNKEWIKMFPNEEDRPARHITLKDLPSNMNVQVEVIAVLS